MEGFSKLSMNSGVMTPQNTILAVNEQQCHGIRQGLEGAEVYSLLGETEKRDQYINEIQCKYKLF